MSREIKYENMSLKFENLDENLFKKEQIDKDQMSNVTGGFQQALSGYCRNTCVMANGDHVNGADICGGETIWGGVEGGWC